MNRQLERVAKDIYLGAVFLPRYRNFDLSRSTRWRALSEARYRLAEIRAKVPPAGFSPRVSKSSAQPWANLVFDSVISAKCFSDFYRDNAGLTPSAITFYN